MVRSHLIAVTLILALALMIGDVVSASLPGAVPSDTCPECTTASASCSSAPLPDVAYLGAGANLEAGALHLVKGQHGEIHTTFSQISWEKEFEGSETWVALTTPTQDVTWSDNAWRVLSGWRDPYVMFSRLEEPLDVVRLGTWEAESAISASVLDHLNYIHHGQERHAWVYLVREDGVEEELGQLPISDPAFVTIVVPARGEVQLRTHDSTVWWVQCLPPLSLAVTKTPDPYEQPEPGGAFDFNVRVDNTNSVPLTLTSLTDNLYGDITRSDNPLISSTTCSVPRPIPSGGSYECAFSVNFHGPPGTSQTDVVTATARDDLGREVQASDDATVRIRPVPSSIDVTKTASPAWMQYPGADVTFRFTVKNTSSVDSVTIDSLSDTVYGDLNGQGDCSVPQTLLPGDSYSCTFTAPVSGDPDSTHRNVVTASGYDDDEEPVSAEDDAVVTIAAVPTKVEFLYFTASLEGQKVVIEWATAWEQDNWGFNLYRGLTPSFEAAKWLHFQQAQGSGQFQGQSYHYDDTDIVAGQLYHYWLEDISVAGDATRHEPVTAAVLHRVFVPLAIQ
jgi:hypothetical protein